MAVKAGNRLLQVGIKTSGGIKWRMSKDYKRFMPNFSHGTAGIAYYLACLYERTGEKRFLEGAVKGAEHLLSIAYKKDDQCLVYHFTPEGEKRYYLGWCHGPVGTGRLFYILYKATGKKSWLEWLKRGAYSIMVSGIPEKETPGFWNNVSICCGTAGVALYFHRLNRTLKDKTYGQFATRMAKSLLGKPTQDGKGLKWMNAEFRKRPEFLVAQPGFMQGAAGIGYSLLKLASSGKRRHIILPDVPY